MEPFLEHIEAGGYVVAHNEAYDRTVWNAQADKYGLPKIKLEQSICSAAWLRQFNLPSKLGDVSKRLLPAEQAKLTDVATGIKYIWSKKNPLVSADDVRANERYCAQDVSSVAALMRLVPPPTQQFLDEYHACARMNDRGIRVDTDMAHAAQTLKPRVERQLLQEIERICGPEVKLRGPSFLKWLQANLPEDLLPLLNTTKKKRVGYEFRSESKISADKSVRAKLLSAIEDRTDCGDIRQALFAFDEANRAAVGKYKAMLKVEHNGVVYNQFVFSGAAQTGRASSHGIQLQNTLRDVPKNAAEMIDQVKELQKHPSILESKVGSINVALGRLVRPTLIAGAGNALAWSDWSAIEARMLPWLSNDAEDLLDVFRSGGDVYIREAAGIYGVPEQQIHDRIADGDPDAKEMRQVGKVAILACGYQGGVGAFQAMAKNYGMAVTDQRADEIKTAWRKANAWAPKLWHDAEAAAMRAVRRPGEIQQFGRLAYVFAPDLLRGTLLLFMPSGRFLAYPEAGIAQVTKFDQPTDTLVFVHPEYGPSATYGGALVQGATQGEAASLLRTTLVECDKIGIESIGQVHDEIIIEHPEDEIEHQTQELVRLMETPPDWANGLPLNAEAEIGYRYKVPR
jgi:DNA polymerase